MPNLTKILVGACAVCCIALVVICVDMKMHYAKIDEINNGLNKRDSIYQARQKEPVTIEE